VSEEDRRRDEILGYIQRVAIPAVREHGWHVHGHMTSATELGGNITYTVGLTEAWLPELAMTGLPHTTAAVVLNDCARTHLRNEMVAGARYHSAAGATVHPIAAPGLVGPLARAMYGAGVRFLQLLWECPHGHVPTDPAWGDDHPRQPVYTFPIPEDVLPRGGGVVGHLDEVSARQDRRRWGRRG
jgi:Domain of unknown function (DUF4262)